jgi:hypothetical protein
MVVARSGCKPQLTGNPGEIERQSDRVITHFVDLTSREFSFLVALRLLSCVRTLVLSGPAGKSGCSNAARMDLARPRRETKARPAAMRWVALGTLIGPDSNYEAGGVYDHKPRHWRLTATTRG